MTTHYEQQPAESPNLRSSPRSRVTPSRGAALPDIATVCLSGNPPTGGHVTPPSAREPGQPRLSVHRTRNGSRNASHASIGRTETTLARGGAR